MSSKKRKESSREGGGQDKKARALSPSTYDDGTLLTVDLTRIISPSQINATKSKIRDKAFKKRAQDAAKIFNETKEKKEWTTFRP